MSSIEKEFDTRRKGKKSRFGLSLKLPVLSRNRSTSSPLERSLSSGAEFPDRSNLRRIREEEDKGSASSESDDDSYDSEEELKKFQQKSGRRRSLSTSAMDDMPKSDDSDNDDAGGSSKQRAGSFSSGLPETDQRKRPDSPTIPPLLSPRSCLRFQTRRRSTSMSDVEELLQNVHKMKVTFSPETVDPIPRNCKYREYCEKKLGLNPMNKPNVKHEMHKKQMVRPYFRFFVKSQIECLERRNVKCIIIV